MNFAARRERALYDFDANIPPDATVIGWKVGIKNSMDFDGSRMIVIRVRRGQDDAYVDHTITVTAANSEWVYAYINGPTPNQSSMNGLNLNADDANGSVTVSTYAIAPPTNGYTIKFE